MRAHRSTHMRSQEWEAHVVRAFPAESHMDMSKEPFCMEIHRKMPGLNPRTPVLCEPAQSKRTWTFHKRFHKSNFVWTFTGKMPHTLSGEHVLYGNLREKTHRDILEEPFCIEICRKTCCTLVRPPRSNTGPLSLTAASPAINIP